MGFDAGSGLGFCALAQITETNIQNRATVNRDMLLQTFQQGTFGPDEIVKMRVAEEIPEAKNCGVSVKMASKT